MPKKREKRPHPRTTGIDKTPIKRRIRALKRARDEAIAGRDYARLGQIRGEIHDLRHQLRKHTELVS